MKSSPFYKPIFFDEFSVTLKYQQLANAIIKAIEDGKLQVDDMLPPFCDPCAPSTSNCLISAVFGRAGDKYAISVFPDTDGGISIVHRKHNLFFGEHEYQLLEKKRQQAVDHDRFGNYNAPFIV